MNLDERLDRLRSDVTFPAAPIPDGRRWPDRAPTRRRATPVIAGVALAAMVLVVVLLVSPDARSTVARWVDFGAIPVRVVDRLTDGRGDVKPLDPLVIGERVAVGEVTGTLALDDRQPDAAYRLVLEDGSGIVTVVYRASEALPAFEDSEIGAMLTASDVPLDLFPWVKEPEPAKGLTIVTVRGTDGVWILAGQLVIERDDPDGTFGLEPMTRRTGHVLIWQEGGVTYRLETRLSREDAIAMAESLVPLPEQD